MTHDMRRENIKFTKYNEQKIPTRSAYYRVAIREKCGIFAMGRQGRRGVSSATGGRNHVKRPSRRGAIVEARRESRPRRGCHVDAQTESERGSEQGGILVRRCRDLRRPVLRALQSVGPVDRRSAISRVLPPLRCIPYSRDLARSAAPYNSNAISMPEGRTADCFRVARSRAITSPSR